MKTYQINKEFASLQECNEWEEENYPNRTYNGESIFMINHSEDIHTGKVIIESVMTC